MFQFKKFTIDDGRCAMKVGTDGVALGAWTSCTGARKVLDVGCGSGLIALMIAQRCEAEITGVEIDPEACCDARANVTNAGWCAGRVTIAEGDFRAMPYPGKLDLIVSNPPFFGSGELSPSVQRALARHEGGLNYMTLIDFASERLEQEGRLSFIYPSEMEDDIIYKAEMSHLKLRRKCRLSPTPRAKAIRTMMELSPTDGAIESEEISIRNDDGRSYSDQFSYLCRDFYLNI